MVAWLTLIHDNLLVGLAEQVAHEPNDRCALTHVGDALVLVDAAARDALDQLVDGHAVVGRGGRGAVGGLRLRHRESADAAAERELREQVLLLAEREILLQGQEEEV